MYSTTRRAPTASAASCSPSSGRCGASPSSASSLWLAGSLSAALPTTTACPEPAAATASSLR